MSEFSSTECGNYEVVDLDHAEASDTQNHNYENESGELKICLLLLDFLSQSQTYASFRNNPYILSKLMY